MASSSESASQASIYTSVSSLSAPSHSPDQERDDKLDKSSDHSPSVSEPEANTSATSTASTTSSDLPGKPKGLALMLYAKSRFDRLSAFFPSLISSHSTDHSAGALHRKPLPNSPNQDRPPGLPSIPSVDSTEKTGGLGTSNSNDTANAPATIKHIPSHNKNSSETSAPAPTMGKLKKTAPATEKPSPLENFAAPSQRSTFPVAEPKPALRLTKEQRRRSSSVNSSMHKSSISQASLAPQPNSPIPDPRGRSSSAQPPGSRSGPLSGNLSVSTAAATAVSRPGSSNGSQSPTRDGERRGRLRRSWLPGGRSRSVSRNQTKATTSAAWILGQNVDYNTSFIANGEKVPELWNESGTVTVYLDPKGSGAGPSFKVQSFVVDYSLVFVELMESEMTSPTSSGHTRSFSGRDSLSIDDATRRVQSPPLPEPQGLGEARLYLPVSMSTPGHRSPADLERMLSIRNMFAFLTGQPLVCTKEQPNLFSVFLNISALLKEFEFTNADGSTFGDAVDMSFHFFMEQMALADVRHSREKTLESLILGERMRSMDLYNEAFAHAVGKYPAIRDLNSPLWGQVSSTTRERLERAYFELVTRQNSVNNRLESFEFPALFSGTASSTSNPDYKDVKFNTWKKSWGKMRQFVLGYYKSNFGSWPPKARSKKNPFTESGLNRQVLKILYSDFCALYDLLVDRESITTRVIDQAAEEIEEHGNPHLAALRKVLGEFDQSAPPVLPPIPFDLPKLPDMTSVKENYYELPVKEQVRLDRNLQEYQMLLILNKAYDFETFKLKMPFLDEFKEFEHKEAKGKTAAEMADQRIGYWLFLYIIIQSLPMLVVDAPGLQFTEGVEYFLCQPPKGHPPWMEDAPTIRKRWYEVAGGGGLVELSTDAVEFSIEGIYHRSHCWLAAKRWELGDQTAPPGLQENLSPLQAPQSVFEDMDPGRSSSPTVIDRSGSPLSGPPGAALRAGSRNSSYRSSIAFGLEPVPIPMEDMPLPGSRVVSARGVSPFQRPVSSMSMMNRSRSSGNLIGLAGSQSQGNLDSRSGSRQGSVGGSTFDDILKDMDQKPKKKKGFF
ncbi:hypothetical protein GGR53DRAFT_82787 [Hypoxylon sp. FL1150]|nr:hypothetical protein GGR53DRAFT_82787 [Hypoxylon sp. FL1150]